MFGFRSASIANLGIHGESSSGDVQHDGDDKTSSDLVCAECVFLAFYEASSGKRRGMVFKKDTYRPRYNRIDRYSIRQHFFLCGSFLEM